MRELDKGAMFPKGNIVGDTKAMRNKITTKSRPRLKFVMLMWLKKNEIGRTEGVKVVIVWR